jgi:prepilin-type N-terminal cleavage/methylation domain-containing protein
VANMMKLKGNTMFDFKKAKRRGFTLLEVMITVLIISVLLAISIPNFLKSRHSAQTKTCLTNLYHIAHAKEQLIAEKKLDSESSVTWNDLIPNMIKTKPICPAGGSYTIGEAAEVPTCTIEDHSL